MFQLLTHYFDRQVPGESKLDKLKVLLTAPSGKASFLIQGVTCHTAYALPVNRNMQASTLTQLSADVANTIREKLIHLKLLIIDEVSIVGSRMFKQIDDRQRQIKGVN